MLITLPADSSSNLDWDVDPDFKGIWHLDFGWKALDPYDTAAFNSHLLAVEEFAKRLPNAKKVVLAKIQGKFSELLSASEKVEERFVESGALNFELFCAQLFSEYIHRLASALPEEAQPMISIEMCAGQKFEEMVLIFSRRRFEHFQLIFTNEAIPIEGDAKIAVSLPADSKYNLETFASLFNSLEGVDYKCIPEELLNEHWEGVDYLIVDPEFLGPAGKRMLYGFEAAGGVIVSTRGPIGFADETSLEAFLTNFQSE